MTCSRCNGLMVPDIYPATAWADYDATSYHRCVMCGNCEDTLILKHRITPPPARVGTTPFRKVTHNGRPVKQ